MIVAGLVSAIIIAFAHIYIFYLESIIWESERVRAASGIGSVEEAWTMKFMAFNQGLYNLFLAPLAIVGVAVRAAGSSAVGLTPAFAGAASILAVTAVLFIASAPYRAAALKQGAFPLLTVGSFGLGLILQALARYSSRMGIFTCRHP